jgi:hypothetical protein
LSNLGINIDPQDEEGSIIQHAKKVRKFILSALKCKAISASKTVVQPKTIIPLINANSPENSISKLKNAIEYEESPGVIFMCSQVEDFLFDLYCSCQAIGFKWQNFKNNIKKVSLAIPDNYFSIDFFSTFVTTYEYNR